MESALQQQLEIMTLEQYENLPEEKRVEVFDGIVYDMASPSEIHQTIISVNCTITRIMVCVNIGL